MTAAMRFSGTGIEGGDDGPLSLLDSVLRGVGQVMFQNNSYSGLLFLIGIAVNSLLFALAAFAGAAISTVSARLLGADRALVRSGMFGFNGALVGVALLYFLRPEPLTWACLVLAAFCATVLMAAMLVLFRRSGLPVLTAPFVLVALCFFLATARFGRLPSAGLLPAAGLPKAASVEGVVSLATVAQGLLNGIGQVFFQGDLLTGALFALGLLISSRRAFVAALAGSMGGLAVGWAMGAAEPAIRAGAFGFNSVLVAIALGGLFPKPGPLGTAYAALGVIVTPFVVAAATAALAPLGVPALTLPFVLVTWAFLLAARAFDRLAPSPG